jgi:hypothetical protein
MTRYGGPWLAYVRLEDPPGLSPITTVGRLPRFAEAPGVVLLRNCMGLAETRSTIADEVAHLLALANVKPPLRGQAGWGRGGRHPASQLSRPRAPARFTPPSSVFAENE